MELEQVNLPTRPMLAAKITDLDALEYPLLASPKLDGIRCLLHPHLGPVSRSFKPIPNDFIRNYLWRDCPAGFDGELMLAEPNVNFNRVQSAVMSKAGEPTFRLMVFDNFIYSHRRYADRVPKGIIAPSQEDIVRDEDTIIIDDIRGGTGESIKVQWLPQFTLFNAEQAQEEFDYWYDGGRGYEGLILRSADSPYKSGRSTLKQQYLLKYKTEDTDEALVIGFDELYRNTNEQEADNFGLAKRSSALAGQVPANTLGALVVEHVDWGIFRIGSGFDVAMRDEIWRRRDHYRGQIVTYKYQSSGTQDKPRFPIWLGFRHPDDTGEPK